MNLGTLALACLLVGGTLTACTGDGETDGQTAASPTSDASPTEEAEEADVDPRAVPTLPDGRLTVQTVVKGRATARGEEALTEGQVVASEDLIFVLPDAQVLTAVDRETGKVAWRTELKIRKADATGACRLVAPPADATAIVVFSGMFCGQIDSYSLEDGSFLESSTDRSSIIPSAAEPIAAGGAVFWADDEGISRIEPDGTSDLVVATVQLGLKGSRSVNNLATIAGSDVLVAASHRPGSADGADYFGLQVSDDGDLEEVWRRGPREAHGPESMLQYSTMRWFMDGVLFDTVRRGVVTPRMLMFDPETGETEDRTFVLERDPPGGYPAWIEGKFPKETEVHAEGQVFSAAGDGGFGFKPNVVRYDLAENEVAWAWEPKFPFDVATSGQPLAVSEDGEHVYVLWVEFDETRLVELDYETGRQQRVWPVPASVSKVMTDVSGTLVGDQLVLWTVYTGDRQSAYAVVLEIE